MNSSIYPILGILCVILAEIGGIGIMKRSYKFPNPTYMMRIGKAVCIGGFFAVILIIFGMWVGAWR
jgi:hypothetical protein